MEKFLLDMVTRRFIINFSFQKCYLQTMLFTTNEYVEITNCAKNTTLAKSYEYKVFYYSKRKDYK